MIHTIFLTKPYIKDDCLRLKHIMIVCSGIRSQMGLGHNPNPYGPDFTASPLRRVFKNRQTCPTVQIICLEIHYGSFLFAQLGFGKGITLI